MVDLIERLRDVVGPAAVLTGDDARLHDQRGTASSDAVAVVRPASTDEVAAVVSLTAELGGTVTAMGGHTGLSGGVHPADPRPAVIVSLERMHHIESIDRARSTMTVQAGVTIQSIQEAAATVERLFAPDWGARGSATIGGGIATDAGGNNVLRYGNMRDQVLGLEVVLADGRVWNGLRALRKDSSGYDLKQLFIGAEGTLGIVTRAVLKLHPATRHHQSALAALTSLEQLESMYELVTAEVSDALAAFELVPEVGLARVCEVFDVARPIDTAAEWYALLKLASPEPVTERLARMLERALDAGIITDAVVAATTEQEERLWFIRDEITPLSIYREHQLVGVKLDTAVPIDRIGEFHERVQVLSRELVPNALAYGFGHAGDGNLHMMVLPTSDADVEEFTARRGELADGIDRIVFELGGTLSAEHGVGTLLRGRVAGQKPPIEWELMRRIKTELDPGNIMNPGKLLPDPGV